MNFRLDIPKIITILFSFVFFLKYVGGNFHLIDVGFPLVLIFILSIIYSFITKRLFKNYYYLILLYLFILYLFIGSWYSNAPNYGRSKTFILLIFVLMASVSSKYIILNFRLFLVSNFAFFVLFIVAYFAFYRSFSNVLENLSPQQRLEMGGDTFNAIGTSQYVGFNLISLYFLLFRHSTIRYRKLIFSFLFLIGIFIMILFGSKGPLLALLLAPLIYFLFYQKANFKKTIVLIVAIVGLSSVLIYPDVILKLIPQQYQFYFHERYFNYETYAEGGRPELYKSVISDIDKKSFLFGKGTGNFGYLHSNVDGRVHPHNIFLELLYENGLIGVSVFIVILFMYLMNKSILYFFSNIHSNLIILIYYFLLCAQVSGDFSDNFALFIFLLLLYNEIIYERRIQNISRVLKKFNVWSKRTIKIS